MLLASQLLVKLRFPKAKLGKDREVAEKTYRPKSGAEGVAVEAALPRSIVAYQDADGKRISLDDEQATAQGLEPIFDREYGETFSVSSWPYSTDNPTEQAFLDSQDMLTDRAPSSSSSSKGDS